MFYPAVTKDEMTMWEHWLPTALNFRVYSTVQVDFVLKMQKAPPEQVKTVLALQKAPPEVMEEFEWARKLDFDEYMIRTPVRTDARDPLLLARAGNQWYRIALWGESLRPLDEIKRLVERSLEIRSHSRMFRIGFGLVGSALGIGFISWLSYLGKPAIAYLDIGFLIFLFAWLPMIIHTPTNAQHDFLDRYQ